MITCKHLIPKVILLIIISNIIAYYVVDNGDHDIQANVETNVVYDTSRTRQDVNIDIDVDTDALNMHERYLLAKVAMAEAEGEDTEGKALIVAVVFNRINDDSFGDTVHDVIYEKVPNSNYHQFSCIDDGRFDMVEPNDDCYDAMMMVVDDGWDKSQGALYYEACENEDNWHSRNLEFLFKHGNHRFYK